MITLELTDEEAEVLKVLVDEQRQDIGVWSDHGRAALQSIHEKLNK